MSEADALQTRAGLVRLRPEGPQDAVFLKSLFAAHARAVLAHAGLPDAQVEQLVDMQHRGQTLSYAARFPDARRWIAELDGGPVARLIDNEEPGALYVVDIAVVPELHGRGIGSALIRATMRAAAERGLGVRALVTYGNQSSLAMFTRLGFKPTPQSTPAELELSWRAGEA